MTLPTDETVVAQRQKSWSAGQAIATVCVVLALLYFVVTRLRWLPFSPYSGLLLNQVGIACAAYLLTLNQRNRTSRLVRALGGVVIFVCFIWGIADYSTNLARLPSTIDDARLGERMACQERLDSAAQHGVVDAVKGR